MGVGTGTGTGAGAAEPGEIRPRRVYLCEGGGAVEDGGAGGARRGGC